jgi:hypothetical protein
VLSGTVLVIVIEKRSSKATHPSTLQNYREPLRLTNGIAAVQTAIEYEHEYEHEHEANSIHPNPQQLYKN